MENPSSSDSSFKKFLSNLTGTNAAGEEKLVQAQLATVELEKKQKEKLDDLKEQLSKIERALSGLDKTAQKLPREIARAGTEFSKIKVKEEDKTVKESLSELVGNLKSTLGKIGDGIKSVFSSELSSSDQSLVEKIKSAGSFLPDVVSAEAGYTAEAERFATERIKQENARREQRGEAQISGQEEKDLRKSSRIKFRDVVTKEEELKGVEEKIKESKKYGFNPTEEDVLKKTQLLSEIISIKKEAGISSIAPVSRKQPVPSDISASEEDDNILSAQEIIADNTKADLSLTKETNDLLNQQLDELKSIKDTLIGFSSVSKENDKQLKKQLADSQQKLQEQLEGAQGSDGGGVSIFDIPGGGRRGPGGRPPTGPGGRPPTGGAPAGGRMGRVLSSLGRLGGPLLATGVGAYSAYKGFTEAKESEQQQLGALEEAVKSGEVTPAEAVEKRKEIIESATEKKGGAIGGGGGIIAGGAGGALLGAKLGTAFGPIGTAVGGVAGGLVGGFAGSKLGKSIGEFGGRLWTGIKNVPESLKKYNEIFKETDKDKGIKPVERLEGTSAAEMLNAGAWEGYSPPEVEVKPTSQPGDAAKQAVTGSSKLQQLQEAREKHIKRGPAINSARGRQTYETVLASYDRAIEKEKESTTVTSNSSQLESTNQANKRGNANWNDRSTVQTVTNADGSKRPMTTDEVIAAKKSLRNGTGTVNVDSNTPQPVESIKGKDAKQAPVESKPSTISNVNNERSTNLEAARKANTGATVAQESTANADLQRDTSRQPNAPVVVSNNITTAGGGSSTPAVVPQPRNDDPLGKYFNRRKAETAHFY